ncbi:hypothetical protein [Nostoc sp.]|uniref:hypothetical protein n=1 Tax=Nostoc sp. TaxID=1180 RepID=UPI002FF62EF3
MTNTKIIELQSDNQVDDLKELSDEESAAVLGGATTTVTVGKTILTGIGKYVRQIEILSEADL